MGKYVIDIVFILMFVTLALLAKTEVASFGNIIIAWIIIIGVQIKVAIDDKFKDLFITQGKLHNE